MPFGNTILTRNAQKRYKDKRHLIERIYDNAKNIKRFVTLEDLIDVHFLETEGHIFLGFCRWKNCLLSYQANGDQDDLEESSLKFKLTYWAWHDLSQKATAHATIEFFKGIEIHIHPSIIYQEDDKNVYILGDTRQNQGFLYITIYSLSDIGKDLTPSVSYKLARGGIVRHWIRSSIIDNGFLGNFGTHMSYIKLISPENSFQAPIDTFSFQKVLKTIPFRARIPFKSSKLNSTFTKIVKMELNATNTPGTSINYERSINQWRQERPELPDLPELLFKNNLA